MLSLLRAQAVVMAILLAACTGKPPRLGEPVPDSTIAPAEDEVVDRSWCGLAITYLEDNLPQIAASDPPQEVAARYRQQYFGEGAAELEESIKMAPPEIRADVSAVVAGLRRAASTGDTGAVTSAQFREAKARVDSYNERSCPRFGHS